MRLRTRLVLTIALASLGPLGILGVGATGVASDLLSEKVTDLQGRTADGLALFVDTWLSLQVRLLTQQTAAWELGKLDNPYLTGFLQLVYTQVRETTIVALTNRAGIDRVPSVYRAEGDTALPEREAITAARFASFRNALPRPVTGAAGEVSLGQPVRPSGRLAPVLPIVLPAADGSDLVLALEMDLSPIARELGRLGDQARDVALMDDQGTLFVGGQAGLVEAERFRQLSGVAASDVRYQTRSGVDVLASCAPVQRAGWMVIVAEPLDRTTTAAARYMAIQTAYIAAVASVLALVLGGIFSRQISGPVESLKDAALAVAEGDLGRRVQPAAEGELAELMRAFNFMSTRLERNRGEIDAKNQEIEAWNAELQARVNARTRELQEAQERLIRSARLAAAGEMGAGLAHELNNPLAGILGLTQVMLARAQGSDAAMLRSVEEQAQRCREIVAHLLRFTPEARRDAEVDRRRKDVVDLDAVMTEVLTLVRNPFRQRGVEIERVRSGELPVRGDRADLGQALAWLLASLRAAAPPGSTLSVDSRRAGGQVTLEFTLMADEVQVGKDDWMASGLGFWAAQQVIAAHGGQLVEPADGAPIRWRVQLPEA